MQKKRICIAVLLLHTLLNFGCTNYQQTERDTMYLTSVLKSQLLNVSRIDIQFGDGNKMSITDSDTIQKLVSQIRKIKVRESTLKKVGNLYVLKLNEDNEVYEIDSNLSVNGKAYEAIDNHASEFNKMVVKIGREKIPNLLPGIKLEELEEDK